MNTKAGVTLGLVLLQIVFVTVVFQRSKLITVEKVMATATVQATVALSATVQEYLTFTFTAGNSIAFGSIIPGTPVCNATSSVANVTTNASNGYILTLKDDVAGTNSALDGAGTPIPDFNDGANQLSATATPTAWVGDGLGVTLWSADTTKEAMWGAGSSVCHASNNYAGVPEAQYTGHTSAGSKVPADTSSWGWKVNVDNAQQTGAYSGNVTFTAVVVLS